MKFNGNLRSMPREKSIGFCKTPHKVVFLCRKTTLYGRIQKRKAEKHFLTAITGILLQCSTQVVDSVTGMARIDNFEDHIIPCF